MKNIFHPDTHNEVLSRLSKLKEDTPAQWGKMSAAQMLAHNIVPIEVLLETHPPVGKPNFLFKLLFKKMLYNDRLYKKNMPTPKAFKVENDCDFKTEKEKLEQTLKALHDKKDQTTWPKHVTFGHLTPEQNGQMIYKHLDHHLRQFGL